MQQIARKKFPKNKTRKIKIAYTTKYTVQSSLTVKKDERERRSELSFYPFIEAYGGPDKIVFYPVCTCTSFNNKEPLLWWM